jgi:hypothetical protein
MLLLLLLLESVDSGKKSKCKNLVPAALFWASIVLGSSELDASEK